MKKILTIIILLIIFGCNNNLNLNSYKDYLEDFKLINNINGSEKCVDIKTLFTKMKTIDGKEKMVNLFGKKCNITFRVEDKSNDELSDLLNDILYDDQVVREEFNSKMESKNLNFSPNQNITDVLNKRKFYWDSIVKETDLLNKSKFIKVIDSVGEWIGAEYLKRTPDTPNLGVIVGHLPEEEYRKYTIMAFESAKQGKEYWSRIEKLISFSKKYSIEDMEYFKKKKIIVPFRFTKFKEESLIDANDDLTKMEFNSIARVLFSPTSKPIFYELSSSIKEVKSRKELLNQAKDILIKFGWNSNLIRINLKKEKHIEYKLYYQLVN